MRIFLYRDVLSVWKMVVCKWIALYSAEEWQQMNK